MNTKNVTCVKCSHSQEIRTHLDTEGYSISSGWIELRDHIDAEHPAFAAQLDAFIGPDDLA